MSFQLKVCAKVSKLYVRASFSVAVCLFIFLSIYDFIVTLLQLIAVLCEIGKTVNVQANDMAYSVFINLLIIYFISVTSPLI
jgi:hypothetical protein